MIKTTGLKYNILSLNNENKMYIYNKNKSDDSVYYCGILKFIFVKKYKEMCQKHDNALLTSKLQYIYTSFIIVRHK